MTGPQNSRALKQYNDYFKISNDILETQLSAHWAMPCFLPSLSNLMSQRRPVKSQGLFLLSLLSSAAAAAHIQYLRWAMLPDRWANENKFFWLQQEGILPSELCSTVRNALSFEHIKQIEIPTKRVFAGALIGDICYRDVRVVSWHPHFSWEAVLFHCYPSRNDWTPGYLTILCLTLRDPY